MTPARENYEIPFVEHENKAVGVVNSDTPFAGQIAFERFGFSDAGVAVALNVLYQKIYSTERFFILRLPVFVVAPCTIVPEFIHRIRRPQSVRVWKNYVRRHSRPRPL